MNKILLGCIPLAALAAIGSASAADLPVKARPPLVAPFTWTGCYIGGFVGYQTGHSKHRSDNPNGTTSVVIAPDPSKPTTVSFIAGEQLVPGSTGDITPRFTEAEIAAARATRARDEQR